MEDIRCKKIKEAREVLMSFQFKDHKDENFLEEIGKLRMAIDEFFSVFNFPRGTAKIFRDKNSNSKTKKSFYEDVGRNSS